MIIFFKKKVISFKKIYNKQVTTKSPKKKLNIHENHFCKKEEKT